MTELAGEPIQDLVDEHNLEHRNPCFGCGPHNPQGLQLKSYPDPDGDGLVARWEGTAHHAGSAGVLGGGVQATLIDCHGIWTATYHSAMEGTDPLPHFVTAGLDVAYKRPAPLDAPVHLRSWIEKVDRRRVYVGVELSDGAGKVCSEGTVVCHRLDESWGENPYPEAR